MSNIDDIITLYLPPHKQVKNNIHNINNIDTYTQIIKKIILKIA